MQYLHERYQAKLEYYRQQQQQQQQQRPHNERSNAEGEDEID